MIDGQDRAERRIHPGSTSLLAAAYATGSISIGSAVLAAVDLSLPEAARAVVLALAAVVCTLLFQRSKQSIRTGFAADDPDVAAGVGRRFTALRFRDRPTFTAAVFSAWYAAVFLVVNLVAVPLVGQRIAVPLGYAIMLVSASLVAVLTRRRTAPR